MTRLTHEIVSECYKALLGRDVESAERATSYVTSGLTLKDLVETITNSPEFKRRLRPSGNANHGRLQFNDVFGENFLFPSHLQRTEAGKTGKSLLIGACLVEPWADRANIAGSKRRFDFLHIDTIDSQKTLIEWKCYDYTIVQIPLRHIFPDRMYIDFIRRSPNETALYSEYLSALKHSLSRWLDRVHPLGEDLPVFYLGFLEPMFLLDGAIAGAANRHEIQCMIRDLNQYLQESLSAYSNALYLDANRVSSAFGTQYIQEDSICIFSHGGLLNDFDYSRDNERIEEPIHPTILYNSQVDEFLLGILRAAEAQFRVSQGTDRAKILFVDLDDTLWRGVLAEKEYVDGAEASEGWPRGIIEALTILKRRGIIISLLSKNDLNVVSPIWTKIYGSVFPLDEFFSLKVNWNNKADNVAEALQEANLSASEAVLLDDNPVERHLISQRFPALRVISAPHYCWKRILILSPELQTPFITNESLRRTETLKARIEREKFLSDISNINQLGELELKCAFHEITPTSPRFARTLELINKTNQFNTTGLRTTRVELERYCADGLVLSVEASDRYTNYGLVGVAILLGDAVKAVVLSCRVFKMEIEIALISRLTSTCLIRNVQCKGEIVSTERNAPCRDLFQRCGWIEVDGIWQSTGPVPVPPHITVLTNL